MPHGARWSNGDLVATAASFACSIDVHLAAIWDEALITALLNAYQDVRRAFAALITLSEVLAEMRDRAQPDRPPDRQ